MNFTPDPLISIIVPVYNMGGFVEQALDSVLGGDYENLEILVIDDGSKDNTEAVIQQFTMRDHPKYDERIQYVFKENGGKSSAVNLGLTSYRGEYLMLLDADDELPNWSLRCRADKLQASLESKSLVIGGFEVFEKVETLGKRFVPKNMDAKKLEKQFYFSLKTPFHLNSCLISRALVDDVGLFDEALIRCQDIDYSIRCLKKAELVETCEEMVYRYRKHRSSRSQRISFRLKTTLHRQRVFRKNYRGSQKVIVLGRTLLLDVFKLGYEVFANFKR